MAHRPDHPDIPIPTATTKTVIDNTTNGGHNPFSTTTVSPEEIKWMHSERNFTRPFKSEKQATETIARDYGESEATVMIENFKKIISMASTSSSTKSNLLLRLLPLSRWSGIGTRHRKFVSWFSSEDENSMWIAKLLSSSSEPDDETILLDIFQSFANYLGRVTAYRAISLNQPKLNKIFEVDCIFPTGQLRFFPENLQQVVEEHGIRKVLVARLFISHLNKLIGKDPSVSLHDDWATTSIIASGYLGRQLAENEESSVFLFEVNVPVILSCGWTLAEVASFGEEYLGPRYRDHPPWFCFSEPATVTSNNSQWENRGCWFDATLLRTERYTFYGVPFLQKCLTKLYRFDSAEEIAEATKPFIDLQEALHEKYPEGECQYGNFTE